MLLLAAGMMIPQGASAQNKLRIHGTVFELDGKQQVPLDFATVSFPEFGIGTTTSNGGKYALDNVPGGKVKIRVQYIGKHTIDTLVTLQSNKQLDFVLSTEDFRLKEVTVTAQHNAAGKSTSSISRARPWTTCRPRASTT